MSESEDRAAVIAVLDRYAEALDRRDWKLLEQVFADQVDFDFGAWRATSRAEVVEHMARFLGGCGPTQHLLGNYRVEFLGDGDRARSRVYVRAFHVGAGAAAGKTYEMGGEYRDELLRTQDGWRSVKRRVRVFFEQGTREVLRPAEPGA